MEREWFAAQVDGAKAISSRIAAVCAGGGMVAMVAVLSLEITWVESTAGEYDKFVMFALGVVVMLAFIKAGERATDHILRKRGLVCPHCTDVIDARYAKAVVVTGFCPECGKGIFDNN